MLITQLFEDLCHRHCEFLVEEKHAGMRLSQRNEAIAKGTASTVQSVEVRQNYFNGMEIDKGMTMILRTIVRKAKQSAQCTEIAICDSLVPNTRFESIAGGSLRNDFRKVKKCNAAAAQIWSRTAHFYGRKHQGHYLHRFSATKCLNPHLSPTTPLTTSHSMNHLRKMSQQTIRRSLHTTMNHLLHMTTTTSRMHPRVSRMCKKKTVMMEMTT